MNTKVKKYLRKSGKVLLWIIGSVIGLFLLIVLLLQVPYVQNLVKDKAVSYLEDKIGTEVQIGRIEIGLPKKVILEGIYFESQEGDTLLAGEKLKVDISLFKLLSNEVELNSVELEGIVANVKRNKDSVFNFDYIIKAFDTGKPKDTTSAPMTFSLDNIELDRIRITYNDAITKNNIAANLGHFDTHVKKFDLENMQFEVPEINLDGLRLTLEQGMVDEIAKSTQKVAEEASSKPDLGIKLGNINLANIDIGYDNAGTRLDTRFVLKELIAEVNAIDLKNQLIDLENFELNGVKGQLTLGKTEKEAVEKLPEESPEAASAQWKFKLANTDIKDVNFRFNNMNTAPVAKGIDYMHLDIKDFNLEGEALSYTTDVISGKLDNVSVSEANSGLLIKKLQTDFYYGPESAKLENLYLETPQTLLKERIIVGYPSIASLQENIGELKIDANLNGSRIGFKDVLTFVPTLADTNPFKDNPNGVLYINSDVEGKVSDLRIANLQIRGIGSTTLAASGRIKGLPDAQSAYFEMNVRELRTTAKDIKGFVPKGTIPANIQLPQSLSARAIFKGTLNNFNTNLSLGSSMGNARIRATFDQRRKHYEKYDANIDIQNFDVGRLISNDSLGRITLKADVKGTGLNPQTANATLKGTLAKAEFNSYTYRNLDIDGSVNNGAFEVTADMADPNLEFDLVASGGFKDKYPNGKIRLNVDIADLNKLNLHAGPLKLRGNVDADITDSDPDNLNGKISLHHFMFANAEEQFGLDSVNIIAESTAEKNSLLISSQIVDAYMTGKYSLTEVPTALSNTLSKYYNTNPGAARQQTKPQRFNFMVHVTNDPVLNKLLPQLERIEPINIIGKYNSEYDSISVNAVIPRIVYGANTISGVVVNLQNEDSALVYNVRVNGVENEQFKVPKTIVAGAIVDNTLTYRLEIVGRKEEEQYMIAGEMRAAEGNTEIVLDPEGLTLNYEPWAIAADNVIRFGESGIYANNFEMSSEGSSIALQSVSEEPGAPLDVTLSNFEIETLTNIIQKEELKIKGNIDGTAQLRNLNTEMEFTSDLTIENLAVSKDTVGNVRIQVNNEVANTYTADVAITGNGNQVNLNGTYNTAGSNFDMDLDIQKLNMSSVQAFTFGNVKEGEGYLSGNFRVTGTATAPNVNGNLKFNDVGLLVTPLNARYESINDNISFTDSGISFNSFKVQDTDNNLLEINGNIATTNYTEFGFDLNVNAENFRVVNSTAKDNDLYYGNLIIDTNINVNGTLESPVVDGNLRINEDTEFTVVLPQQDPSIADREGIVEFIDQDNLEIKQRLKMEEDFNQSDVTGMDVSVAIEIVKEAELNLIIDKGNGDFLRLQGEAQLTGGIDPSGKTTLTGRYEFTEGAYEMTFNFLKRKFEIQEGSYILWTGEPTEANINITAVYQTEAAPLDLLDGQLNVSQSERNTYKQKIPFNTLLKMEGELLSPELSFDIVLPEGNYNVSTNIINNSRAKLEQLRQEPSELNKQVFALLLLNRFIGENPFASETGTSGEALARQSVSKILSQQLNNLASDLISGVELNFDLESTEDYTTGQRENRTDLNVGISKRLLNDRLKVTVGSSFGLEGPQQANEETTNIAGDVSVDYELTKDGRYMVRAYRKNEYQVALQGQVVETGVAFIITMDYDKFRELFQRSEEEKDMRQRERERRKREKEESEKEKAAKEENEDLPPNTTKDEE
ncbi:translocation/assembly module TamB domain-containing protein [Flavobacterium sp. D11R37]|uniref:translocation/assembly module TamB domain-containing protein n=1 Tax=Flavobacterium coralii TaxID=2838017 RepID=UPI001CA6640F|nr:translocation/assembly module TamB domain-containing protein [Flavobacterium coralii]MBY8961440.1 translocation/assembly module TamB domain-containing protein [Flavobacterium coralii]